MKTCPFCAEQIQDAAVKCKHCGERLTGGESARPGAELVERPTVLGLTAGAEIGGRYRILAVAGRGGMGVVYRAEDQTLGIEVAIKVLPPEVAGDARAVAALKAEAKLCLGLTHPNIVRLYDFREIEGLSCLIMEYVGGGSLLQRLGKVGGGLPEAEAIRCAMEAAAGLGHAHARGVLHRDVKPANLLVGDDGTVKVADFGIARVAQDSYTRVTGRVTSGTFAYMSPEQLDGEACDARSDIYSLGVTLYELLSGQVPFHTGDIYRQQKEKAPPRLAGVSEWLWTVLERMLAKPPAKRYQTMTDVAAALEDSGRAAERARQESKEQACKEAERKAREEAQRQEQADRAAAAKLERDRFLKEQAETERLAKAREAAEAEKQREEEKRRTEKETQPREQKQAREKAETERHRAEEQKAGEAERMRSEAEARRKREQVEREEKVRREREAEEQAHSRRTRNIAAAVVGAVFVLGLVFVNNWQSGKRAEEVARQAQVQRQSQEAEQQRQAEAARVAEEQRLQEQKRQAQVAAQSVKPKHAPAAQTGSPTGSPGKIWREPITGMEFVWIPGGEFEMGSTESDAFETEKPVHRVRVDGFWMGKSEVTQGQWQVVMGSNPSHFSSCGEDCPVEQVSWDDAQDYNRKVSSRSGKTLRLPTEAEWEYAARGGSVGQKWAGTDSESALGEYAWYAANSGSQTHRVCTKRANRFGLCDMSGNVWEWCQDWYGNYSAGSQTNPAGPSSGSFRVFRGGGWLNVPRFVRAANRGRREPGYRDLYLGFRLVAPPGQQ